MFPKSFKVFAKLGCGRTQKTEPSCDWEYLALVSLVELQIKGFGIQNLIC